MIWYRVPVASDRFNWRWSTLAAVMAGRQPAHKLEVVAAGDNPVDLAIANTGEADEEFAGTVTVTWDEARLEAADALAGWTLRTSDGQAVFEAKISGGLQLAPGAKRSIGWLRYDKVPPLRFEISSMAH